MRLLDDKEVSNINAYLVDGPDVVVQRASKPTNGLSIMSYGNKPLDDGNLLLSSEEVTTLNLTSEQQGRFIKRIYGSREFIKGLKRYCLWIENEHLQEALGIEPIRQRVEGVRAMRLASRKPGTRALAERAHRMCSMYKGKSYTIVVPRVSSGNREFLPVGIIKDAVLTDKAFALYDAPLWNMSVVASRIHLVWVATVGGRLKTDFSYSNVWCWNTFPIPALTDENKAELTRCAEGILSAREVHAPATIADLYAPGRMLENLQEAHDRNDETLERIYIGRRFRDGAERLAKLFEMYAG